MRALWISLVSFALLAPCAGAQEASEAARAFLAARSQRDWSAVADFADSAGLAVIRAVASKTIRDLALMQSGEVRARLAAAGADATLKMMDAATSFAGGSVIRFTFAGVTDTAMLRSLSDRELATRWFQAKDPSHLSDLMMHGVLGQILSRAPDGGMEIRAELDSAMRAPLVWDVVGVVEERGARPVFHVIYRMAADGPTGVLSFRRTGDRWYLASLDPPDQLDQLLKLELSARQQPRSR